MLQNYFFILNIKDMLNIVRSKTNFYSRFQNVLIHDFNLSLYNSR